MSTIGAVVIGRNEGERLVRCLDSLGPLQERTVYVDSGSTDGSAPMARERGVEVLDLDMSIPFTAARARNAGSRRLLELHPDADFIQFVDGDCEIDPDWIVTAANALREDVGGAVVCGRLRERNPEASVYNRLCDLEWRLMHTSGHCGGNSMMRVHPFREAGGFNETLIAGEEPELCVRFRKKGWSVLYEPVEMALHDAAMHRFGQWWTRAFRAGYGYAEGSRMHGRSGHWTRESRSAWFWGLVLPLAAIVPAWWTWGLSLLLLPLGYGLLFWRIANWARRQALSAEEARLYATFLILAKVPEMLGQVRYHLNRLLGRRQRIMEYKTPAPVHSDGQPAATPSAEATAPTTGAEGDEATAPPSFREKPDSSTKPVRSGDQPAIAYLVNLYPRTSHSFIRREIEGLEALGCRVLRISARPCRDTLVNAADREELAKTRVLLAKKGLPLLGAMGRTLLGRPRSFARGLHTALRLGRTGDVGILRHLIYFAEACQVVRWCRAFGAEHLHVHFATNPVDIALIARDLGGPPYSFTVHGPDDIDRAPYISYPEKVGRSVFVAAISSFARSHLFRWSRPADWHRVREVHCGVDATFLEDDPSPVPDVPRFVSVGRLCKEKGQVLLLEAFARVLETTPDAELVLVGDGDLRPAVEERVRSLGIREQVILRGWASSEEVREEMLRARAFVLPSFAEGLPVVIMEALALGRPVLSTYIAGIPELVEPGVNGWLVPAGNIGALTEALGEILATDVKRLTAMGEEGATRVRERHDARKEAGKIHALICGREDAPPPEVPPVGGSRA